MSKILPLILTLWASVLAIPPGSTTAAPAPAEAPVVVSGFTLWMVRRPAGAVSPQTQADLQATRLEAVVRNPFRKASDIRLVHGPVLSEIVLGGQPLAGITDEDAAAEGAPRTKLAEERLVLVQRVVQNGRERFNLRRLALGLGLAVAIGVALLWLARRAWRAVVSLERRALTGESRLGRALRIQELRLVEAEDVRAVTTAATRVLGVLLGVAALILYAMAVLALSAGTGRACQWSAATRRRPASG